MPLGAPTTADPFEGLVLDRQFRLLSLLGSGAMAHVYRARQLGVGRDVAIKILRPELLARPEVVTRFRSEAEVAARLDHPHVLVVHAVGEVPSTSGGPALPYVALELLEGPSLRRLLETSAPLPIGRALHLVLALADAAGEAHAHGIVHRDLKPENVILVRRGNDPDYVKLLDFGLAKQLEPGTDCRTREGSVLGTARYVSPEGAEGRSVTPASDCYALATMLYECLSGRTPFEAPSAVTLLAQQATAEPPELRTLVATPVAIAEVVMRNLAKKPEQRSADGRAFGRELADAARRDALDEREYGPGPTLLGTRSGLAGPAFAPQSPPQTARVTLDSPATVAELAVTPRSSAPSRTWIFVLAFFLLGAAVTIAIAASVGGAPAAGSTR